MEIVRFITAGNVDDGKSTLIGRLLYETGNIKDDILESVTTNELGEINLAFLTDGLRAERTQGITIDVAYKYFYSKTKKYIIVDAPGHFQFTKNLVTGASLVYAMIILIDANLGITEQTRRHVLVASFLGISNVIVAINKMDSVEYNQTVFESISASFLSLVSERNIAPPFFIPISALKGENIGGLSVKMPWYKGDSLIERLESIVPVKKISHGMRFIIQHVSDIDNENQEIFYFGKLISGNLKVGDFIAIYPEKYDTVITSIYKSNEKVLSAKAGDCVSLTLGGEFKPSRGHILGSFYDRPQVDKNFFATIFWMDSSNTLSTRKEYLFRINAKETRGKIVEILHVVNPESYHKEIKSTVEFNEFCFVEIVTTEFMVFDLFMKIPENGRGIVIDLQSKNSVGAFTIGASNPV